MEKDVAIKRSSRKEVITRVYAKVLLMLIIFTSVFDDLSMDTFAMTTHNRAEAVEWANAQIGKALDQDGVYGAQCVDLIKYYYVYLGAPTPYGNAIDYASNSLPSGWTRVYENFQPGDVAVWKANHSCSTCSTGSYGHVGIITSADTSWFNVVDQNGPTNKGYCKANTYPTSALKCAIRPDFDNYSSTVFSSVYAENITATDATMGAVFDATRYVTTAGLYFGTDPNNLKKITENANCNAKKIYYSASKWIGTLNSNTTYYYKVFATIGGTEYVTDLQSFKTTSMFSDTSVADITETNAVMKATLNAVSSLGTIGVYFGTDPNNMRNIVEYANCSAKYISYDANKWIGTLHPGTTYYFQIYAYIGGVEHRADMMHFSTLDQSKPVINSAEIVSITGSGYTVRCKASDNGHILRVCFPTWTTANDQDDLVNNWYDNTAVYNADSNGYYTFKVNISDHNNEGGWYNTHVYVYDTVGNYTVKTLSCEVYPLKSISLSKSSIVLDEGASTTLSVTYNPTNTTEAKTVSWKSSNSNVATVNSAGQVTAVSAGQATITATVAGKTAACTVTVKDGVEAKVRAFVERMYTVALGRTADVDGVNYWTGQLVARQQDGASLAQGFILGDEFVSKDYSSQQYVNVLYETFFDRAADSAGSMYWVQLLNGGSSRKAVLAGFVNSEEFDALCTGYGITRGTMMVEENIVSEGIYSFVERLYTCALERQSDAEGINYWAQRIATKEISPETVAKSFFMSAEYIGKNVRNQEYVETLYKTFMDRTADSSGMSYWLNELSNGLSRESALSGFAQSAEFKTIMASYGL